MEDLEQELYELQEELEGAEMELYCWEQRVRSLNAEKEQILEKMKEK